MTNYQATVENHALLFALLSQAAQSEEGGSCAIRQAVRQYGEERGARMAQRAQQDGLPLTVDSYLLYGEWEVPAGAMKFEVYQFEPEVRMKNWQCPWHLLWKEKGLISAATVYCQEVDEALARGFHPEVAMEVEQTQMEVHDTPPTRCEFVFPGLAMDGERQARLQRNQQTLGSRAREDWNYHTGHLLWSVSRQLERQLGEAAAQKIVHQALEDYQQAFGPAARQRLEQESDSQLDYTRANYEGTPGLEA